MRAGLIFFTMLSYNDIIKRAYLITKSRPLLWLFGMFLLGTFNVYFLRLRSSFPASKFFNIDPLNLFWYFERHPGLLALVSASILFVSVASLLLTNLSRVMLLLFGQDELRQKQTPFAKQFKISLKYLWPIIQVSLLTTMFMLAAVAVLVAPLMVDDLVLQSALWVLGLVIFFPIAFTISSINIFTGMFIVLYNLPVKKSFNAGTDFFISNWADLVGVTLVLLAAYLVGYGLVQTAWLIIRYAVNLGELQLQMQGALRFLPVFIIIKALVAFCLWVILGALNAFVNIVLLLFFINRVKVSKGNEEEKLSQPAYHSVP